MDPAIAVRVPSVIFGVLTVFFTYLIASKMYNSRKAGALSALFLAFLPWHIIMSRIGFKAIMAPFFGAIIFYFLYAGVKDKKTILFLSSFAALGIGSFYTYPSAWVFIPVFALSLVILKKTYGRPGRREVFFGFMLFFVSIVPLLTLALKVNFLKNQTYHSIFKMIGFSDPGFYSVFFNNFIINLGKSFRLFFFPGHSPIGLFAPAITAPLMVSAAVLPLIVFSLVYAVRKRSAADIIMLIWLLLAFLGPCLFSKDGIEARFLLTVLPVPLVLTARLLADLYDHSSRSKALRIVILVISFSVITRSTGIMAEYYAVASDNKGEWLMNSFGSRDAAGYLFEDNSEKDYAFITDFRMTVVPYLKYYTRLFDDRKEIFGMPSEHLKNYEAYKFIALYSDRPGGPGKGILEFENKLLEENKVVYYFLWSPETHPDSEHVFLGGFSRLSRIFRESHPRANPVKKILYPDGSTAIEVFKVYR
jgi:hypothetical protein